MRVFGIDLGTTNSLIAVMEDSSPTIIAKRESAVMFEDDVKVGAEAQVYAEALRSTKRLIGKAKNELREDELARFPIAEVNSDDSVASQEIILRTSSDKHVTPLNVASEILFALRKDAEQILGCEVRDAIVTVPAYFDDAQRSATRLAAKMAGIEVIRLINEPTAAAVAYGFDKKETKRVIVYDLGGGTFDVSILQKSGGVLKVVATGGDTCLGGDDFDLALMRLIMQRSGKNIDRVRAQHIKEAVSDEDFAILEEYGIAFDDVCQVWMPLIERTIKIMKQVMHDAEFAEGAQEDSDIAEVVMVGGASKMPLIRDVLARTFALPMNCDINPDDVVALGAAIHANALQFKGSDLLLDVTPLSLGIEVKGQLVEVIIPRNTSIPAIASKTFGVQHKMQRFIVIHVVQGEGGHVDECRSLSTFRIGCSENSRVKVTFCIDADGILSVSAFDEFTNEGSEIICLPSYDLENADMIRLMKN